MAVVLGVVLDFGQGGGVGVGGFGDHALQAGQGVEILGVVSAGESSLDGFEVVGGDIGHAQQGELGLGGVAVHDVLHRIGQVLNALDSVDVGSAFAVDHIAQQAHLVGLVDVGDAQQFVLRLREVSGCGFVGCVVQNELADGNKGLHVGCGAHVGTGDACGFQCAVEHVRRGLACAADAGDANVGVGLRGGCRVCCGVHAVVIGVGGDLLQRRGFGVHGRRRTTATTATTTRCSGQAQASEQAARTARGGHGHHGHLGGERGFGQRNQAGVVQFQSVRR